jgi:hypothetical protein
VQPTSIPFSAGRKVASAHQNEGLSAFGLSELSARLFNARQLTKALTVRAAGRTPLGQCEQIKDHQASSPIVAQHHEVLDAFVIGYIDHILGNFQVDVLLHIVRLVRLVLFNIRTMAAKVSSSRT